jgi:hypothetical protein
VVIVVAPVVNVVVVVVVVVIDSSSFRGGGVRLISFFRDVFLLPRGWLLGRGSKLDRRRLDRRRGGWGLGSSHCVSAVSIFCVGVLQEAKERKVWTGLGLGV